VPIDASVHDWLEGRGEGPVRITLIDDATSHLLARCYPSGAGGAPLDLVGRWPRRHGRPLAFSSDRHSIFEPQDKGQALPEAEPRLGRALRELGIDLIGAHRPQAKGRVERPFGTAPGRWVKGLRRAGVATLTGANALLGRLLPGPNRRVAEPARPAGDAHRPLGPGHDLAAILSAQAERVVANDDTSRFRNRSYQLLQPVYPGQGGGKVVRERRLDGSPAIRFRGKYLKDRAVPAGGRPGGPAPRPPGFSAGAADAGAGAEGPAPGEGAGSPGRQPAGGRSGRTPAAPYPPAGGADDARKGPRRPAEDHPWRKPFQRRP
jgi:hypothetical protein